MYTCSQMYIFVYSEFAGEEYWAHPRSQRADGCAESRHQNQLRSRQSYGGPSYNFWSCKFHYKYIYNLHSKTLWIARDWAYLHSSSILIYIWEMYSCIVRFI